MTVHVLPARQQGAMPCWVCGGKHLVRFQRATTFAVIPCPACEDAGLLRLLLADTTEKRRA
jgi:hypothetical protein